MTSIRRGIGTEIAREMLPWLPTLLVIVVTAMALTGARSPPATARARRLWMASILLCGSFAIAGTVWQGRKEADEITVLSGMASPQSSRKERNAPTVSDLTKQVKALEDQVKGLEAGRQIRTITPQTAEIFTAYLGQFGKRRVIVSCIPDDVEAYQYANQLVNILKAADWEAHGPEVTKIFGDVRAPGINVYVNADNHSDTVKILLDGFAKFNIPYQTRVTPSQAIPDSETVELFIGARQTAGINAGAD
jgi:hypothetical protein